MLRQVGVIGWVGLLLVPFGLHLVWQARREVLYWLGFYFSIFQRSVHHAATSGVDPATPGFQKPPREQREILPLLAGMALMILGQLLFILDLLF